MNDDNRKALYTARQRSAVTLLLATLVACGGSSGSGGPTIDELPALLAGRLCPEVEGCLDPRARKRDVLRSKSIEQQRAWLRWAGSCYSGCA